MYQIYPHVHIHYGDHVLTAITGRRKPMFLLFDLMRMLKIRNAPLIFKTLHDQDVDTLIDYLDVNEFMPFEIVTPDGVRKLIEVSSLPPDEKVAIKDWFENDAIPIAELAWERKLEPLWKLVDDENWFYGLEYATD